MQRIEQLFQSLRQRARKALIPFVTAGDPALEVTVPVMHALVRGGADLIELGIPFSDPSADGPTIQRSSERALQRGVGLLDVIDCVRAFRRHDATTPVVLMGYLNPVEIIGLPRVAQLAAKAGVDGVLLVDLPPEEAEKPRTVLAQQGIALISLVAPTTTPARYQRLQTIAQGYLYYVNVVGITGVHELDFADIAQRITDLRRQSPVPVVAGFGIHDATSAQRVAQYADGVVIGSALVACLSELVHMDQASVAAEQFLMPIRYALDQL